MSVPQPGNGVPEPHNWGRWGTADERGTLNLLTPDVVKAAVGSVRDGRVLPLAMPIKGSTSGRRRPPCRICRTVRCPSISCQWTAVTTPSAPGQWGRVFA